MTTEQNLEAVETKARYFIDLSWYQKQERSFTMLVATRLCPASRKKEKSKSETTLLRTIRQCCSKREGFVTPNMPLMEIIFRIFLANGNQPLEVEQIQEQLMQISDISSVRDISLPRLKRILDNDRYYGLRTAPESAKGLN